DGPMGDGTLLFEAQLAEGLGAALGHEYRVEPEPISPPRPARDRPPDQSLEEDGLAARFAVAHRADESGGPVESSAGRRPKKRDYSTHADGLERVSGVGTWEPLERPHEEPRVLDQDGPPRGHRRGPRRVYG